MKPILSADGEEIGWINYKTGNKYIHFKMDVDSRQATISIVLDHPDEEVRGEFFGRLRVVQAILYDLLEEEDWRWKVDHTDEYGRRMSMVYKQLTSVNIFRNEDWPAIISFFKPRIIALDNFWSMVKYQFSGAF